MSIPEIKNRKVTGIVIVVALVAAFVAFPSLQEIAYAGHKTNQQQQTTTFLQYSVKYICGEIPQGAIHPPFEPELKPGNYATAINIHNTGSKDVTFKFKLATVTDEDMNGKNDITPLVTETLSGDEAMEIDCTDIANTLIVNHISPDPFEKGFLVILVQPQVIDDPLDVVAVYTSLKEDEVLKNKILYCTDRVDPFDGQCDRFDVFPFAEIKREVVVEVNQNEVIVPEQIVRSIDQSLGETPIIILDVDVALGVGVGQSIDVEYIKPMKVALSNL